MNLTDELFSVDDEGWCRAVRRASCTNFDARPPEAEVSLLIVHNISLPPGEFGGGYIEDLFANRLDCDAHPYFNQLRDLRVSAHFLIRRDGAVLQFVPTVARAWHAGVSRFNGRERCNDFSVGVELEGSDVADFCDAQYTSLAHLAYALSLRHPISDVRGHEHIAPGRKTDPGPHFDWHRFRDEFVALQTTAKNVLTSDKENLSFPV